MKAKWIVNVLGRPSCGFEISVVRENNLHGIKSYGWFDKDKIFISSKDTHIRDTTPQMVWLGLKALAQYTADTMNNPRRIVGVCRSR